MKRVRSRKMAGVAGAVSAAALLVVATFAMTASAFGPSGATRTWVSGVGDDANPCSRTAPCKTFAGAISKTASGGEINVLDPGGFGAVTITKAITISAEEVEGGVLVNSTNAIIVNAPSTDVVTLRGLDIEGGLVSLVGIKFLAGAALHVQDSTIRGFAAGTDAAGIKVANTAGVAKIDVTDTILSENGNGTTGGAIVVQPSGTGVGASVTLTRVQMLNNATGLKAVGTGNTGGINVALNDSVAQGNGHEGALALTTAGGSAVQITVDSSTFTRNSIAGVSADGPTATVRIGRSLLTGNAFGYKPLNGGTVESYLTNENRGNATDGTATTVAQN